MRNEFIMLARDDFNQLNLKLEEILSEINILKEGKKELVGNKWITEKQAQELTGKKGTTLWKMRNKGLLTFTKLNNRVYYDVESIMALLENNKQQAYHTQDSTKRA